PVRSSRGRPVPQHLFQGRFLSGNESKLRLLSSKHWYPLNLGTKRRALCPKSSTPRLPTNTRRIQSRPCNSTNSRRSLRRVLRIPFRHLILSAKLNPSRRRIDLVVQ